VPEGLIRWPKQPSAVGVSGLFNITYAGEQVKGSGAVR
jgi:hypothetical protein